MAPIVFSGPIHAHWLVGNLGFGLAAEAALGSYHGDQLAQLSTVPLLQYHFMPSADWQAVMFAGVGVLKGHADGV